MRPARPRRQGEGRDAGSVHASSSTGQERGSALLGPLVSGKTLVAFRVAWTAPVGGCAVGVNGPPLGGLRTESSCATVAGEATHFDWRQLCTRSLLIDCHWRSLRSR